MTTIQDRTTGAKILVGVRGLRCVLDTTLDGERITFLPKVSVLVSTGQRGIHMSRLIESVVIGWLETTKRQKVEEIGLSILKYIQKRKETIGTSLDTIQVVCEGEYIYELMEPCMVTITTKKQGEDVVNLVGVRLTCISACPCALDESGGKVTHTQNVDVTVVKKDGSVIELIKFVESVLTPTRTMLKRSEEVATIEAAFKNPMFVEDIIRALSPKVDYVTVVAHDAIHKHEVVATSVEED